MRNDPRYLKLLKNISRNLREIRNDSALTQEEIAEIIGFSTRYYQKLESGRQSPNLVTLYQVCINLKIDISLLLKRPS